MRRLTMLCCLGVLAMVVVSCGGGTEQAPPADETQAMAPAQEPEPAAEETAALPMVEVSAEGTEFDPPVQAAQLPDGVWYCNMDETVHYARAEEGDGTCPKCGMKLVQKMAAAEPSEPMAEPAAEPSEPMMAEPGAEPAAEPTAEG